MAVARLKRNELIKLFILVAGSVLLGMIGATSMQLRINTEEKTKIITIESGSIELSEEIIPKVEEVDGGRIDVTTFNTQGEVYPFDTPAAFVAATENKCIIEGNLWGAQCVSLAQAFWSSYTGRGISDCGTGAARGIWDCKYINAGEDFDLVEGFQNLQVGDWAVFNSGLYGHIGMVIDEIQGNYIPLYGENQGGKPCEAGGSEPNTILISNKTLLGAFRPKIYIKQEPAPIAPDGGIVK